MWYVLPKSKAIRKLKLERLMWKAESKMRMYEARASEPYTQAMALWEGERSERWESLYEACKEELEQCDVKKVLADINKPTFHTQSKP